MKKKTGIRNLGEKTDEISNLKKINKLYEMWLKILTNNVWYYQNNILSFHNIIIALKINFAYID